MNNKRYYLEASYLYEQVIFLYLFTLSINYSFKTTFTKTLIGSTPKIRRPFFKLTLLCFKKKVSHIVNKCLMNHLTLKR